MHDPSCTKPCAHEMKIPPLIRTVWAVPWLSVFPVKRFHYRCSVGTGIGLLIEVELPCRCWPHSTWLIDFSYISKSALI